MPLLLGSLEITSDSSAAFGLEKAFDIGTFMFQKHDFPVDPTGIACQASVCTDHPMAGNDNGNGIMSHCTANRLRGHGSLPQFGSRLFRDRAIGGDLSVRDPAKAAPYSLLKRTADRL